MNDKLITTRYLHLHLSEHSTVAASHLMSPAVPLAAQDTHAHVTHYTLLSPSGQHQQGGDHWPVCVPAPWRPHVTLALVTVTLLPT